MVVGILKAISVLYLFVLVEMRLYSCRFFSLKPVSYREVLDFCEVFCHVSRILVVLLMILGLDYMLTMNYHTVV